ncbi:hypothetical protein Pla52o_33770 [Novipirellula galeiformis]|uniref:Uncharacterized protein n=1 Tax=Novipirellula galeiformis TaxID=2528004 RepID=A0A5C6CGB8_9BACT|nr:hypothetical protein Pla52o_33770 [Novipirellula galeiformis]
MIRYRTGDRVAHRRKHLWMNVAPVAKCTMQREGENARRREVSWRSVVNTCGCEGAFHSESTREAGGETSPLKCSDSVPSYRSDPAERPPASGRLSFEQFERFAVKFRGSWRPLSPQIPSGTRFAFSFL